MGARWWLRRPCVVCGRPVWVWLRRVCLDCLAAHEEGTTMNDQTTDALNLVADQLARIATAIEAGTAYMPRHVAEPDDQVDDAEVVDRPAVWTFEDLEALPIGWALSDRDGDRWEKVGYRGDGTSMWRCGDSDSLPRSSEALMRWVNPVNVAGMTVQELAAAAGGTRVVDALNDTWRKNGDEFVHVQWPSAAHATPETLHQYGPILEATV